MKVTLLSFLFSLSAGMLFCQDFPSLNWFHEEYSTSGYPSISSQISYDLILKNKNKPPIVVAVIDTGVDIEHEDLKENVWINLDEIPENGIDDDKNGYIDDIHGWNFIGNRNGENVYKDSYEMTRILSKLQKRFEHVPEESLSKDEMLQYALYQEVKQKVESRREKAEANIKQLDRARGYLNDLLLTIKVNLGKKELSIANLEDLSKDADSKLFAAINFLKTIHREQGILPSIEELEEGIKFEFQFQKEGYLDDLNYAYNTAFDSRVIIGDKYEDSSDRFYGNNDVKGPDPFHGTHVSGIIAAERGNNIGIDGIARNVKIMSVRVIPDGDEHDKDVANAIRYAVENGASIINMSFGKYYEWDKNLVDNAVRYAEKNDVLLVHAAGNESTNIDTALHYPSRNYKEKKGFLFFKKKRADNWIEVGALSWKNDETLLAPFTNYGKQEVDVFAPGMFIYSTAPGNDYTILQGTSMAAPVVTGIAAVLRSYFPGLTAKQVKEVILDSTVGSDQMLEVPGLKEKYKLSDLCSSGGVVNLYHAIIKAARVKAKKKIKTGKKRKDRV